MRVKKDSQEMFGSCVRILFYEYCIDVVYSVFTFSSQLFAFV